MTERGRDRESDRERQREGKKERVSERESGIEKMGNRVIVIAVVKKGIWYSQEDGYETLTKMESTIV